MKEYALITGASGGIGLELAREIAADGWNLILVARDSKKLEKAKKSLTKEFGVKVETLSADLSKPGSASQLYKNLKKSKHTVSLLVNNAGFGLNGRFHESDLKKELDMIRLNVESLVELTHLFSQEMVKKGQGKILNVASTAGFQPGPQMANYYATKAYVLSFSEAISEELKPSGVTVSCLCPGPTSTEFFKRANMEKANLAKSGSLLVMDASSVAKIAYKGLQKGKAVIIPGVSNKIMAQSVRISPRFLVRKIAGLLNSKSG